MEGRGRVELRHGHVVAMDDVACKLWHADRTGATLAELFGDGPVPAEPEARCVDGTRQAVGVAWDVDGDSVVLHVWDDEERRQLQQQRLTHEHQLAEAQQVANIGSWSWDIQQDRITWSDELYRIYGLEPQAFPATFEAYLERIHPEDKELAAHVVQQAFQDHGPFSFDHRIVRPDGEVRWVHGQGDVVVHRGQPVRMFGISQDITETRASQERAKELLAKRLQVEHLREVDANRGRMLNTLAHEIKNPLTPLYLQWQMLKDEHLGPIRPEQGHALDVMGNNLRRLHALVSDVLDVARIGSGRLSIRPRPIDTAKLLADCLHSAEATAKRAGVTLEPHLPPHVPVDADPERLGQVLDNVLSNAIKFSESGGLVRVDADAHDGEVHIHVHDDGIGLSPEQRKRLFEPFARAHQDHTRPGNGLGLHICKGIVEGHGGRIDIRSDGPGKGADVEITLPTVQAPHQTPAETAAVAAD